MLDSASLTRMNSVCFKSVDTDIPYYACNALSLKDKTKYLRKIDIKPVSQIVNIATQCNAFTKVTVKNGQIIEAYFDLSGARVSCKLFGDILICTIQKNEFSAYLDIDDEQLALQEISNFLCAIEV